MLSRKPFSRRRGARLRKNGSAYLWRLTLDLSRTRKRTVNFSHDGGVASSPLLFIPDPGLVVDGNFRL